MRKTKALRTTSVIHGWTAIHILTAPQLLENHPPVAALFYSIKTIFCKWLFPGELPQNKGRQQQARAVEQDRAGTDNAPLAY